MDKIKASNYIHLKVNNSKCYAGSNDQRINNIESF